MDTDTAEKIAFLKIQLKQTKSIKRYRSLLGKIAGLSGDRQKKSEAGKKGGRGRRASRLH